MEAQSYQDLTSLENIFQAWKEFRKGKSKRRDVRVFEYKLEDNLYSLCESLQDKTYRHGSYESFYVCDPKRRHIHKASVRDRVVHHLLYSYLYKLFDPSFIHDSYSCRLKKGTHKGVARLENFARKVSKNHTDPCWALKCDIKKFFATVDHQILLGLLKAKIEDFDVHWLLEEVVGSFHSEFGKGKGIPLGNLTSQVFANIYLDKLDQFVKRSLKVKYYLRYADDREYLLDVVLPVTDFLKETLNLELHPQKLILRKFRQGIDFLGYVVLPYYRLVRAKTRRRISKRVGAKLREANKQEVTLESFDQSLRSYLGVLRHASAYKVTQQLKNVVWFGLPREVV